MHVVVAGGTGLIGGALVSELVRSGRRVTVLTRRPEAEARRRLPADVSVVRWAADGRAAPLPADTDAVVNLAGAAIARRWTNAAKRLIVDSRLNSTRGIVSAIEAMEQRGKMPPVLINASAVGYYGPRGDEPVTEAGEAGDDFLARVCVQWEAAAMEATGARVVLLRTGFVVGRGGALPLMMLPFRLFVGGPLGSGQQWMPWIHIDDVVGLIQFALDNETITGPVNVSAPEPVQNREFARALGRVMRRPSFVPTPAWTMRLVLGGMAEMVLTGQRAVPRAALEAGYRFRFTDLEPALRDVIGG